MYIGIDLEVHYWLKTKRGGILLKNAKDINTFRQELAAMDPNDFVLARATDKNGNESTTQSRDELVEILYKYMFTM